MTFKTLSRLPDTAICSSSLAAMTFQKIKLNPKVRVAILRHQARSLNILSGNANLEKVLSTQVICEGQIRIWQKSGKSGIRRLSLDEIYANEMSEKIFLNLFAEEKLLSRLSPDSSISSHCKLGTHQKSTKVVESHHQVFVAATKTSFLLFSEKGGQYVVVTSSVDFLVIAASCRHAIWRQDIIITTGSGEQQ